MKKILIIGGCGYIGSRLFIYLIKKGYKVDTVDLEWFGNYVNPKNMKCDYRNLTKSFLNKYYAIILLAGFSSVQMCIGRMKDTFRNDVENFILLLEKLNLQKFIYASSSSIYGNTQKMQVTEDYDRYVPSNYYDLNKKVIDNYAQMSKANYYGLRFGTICGYSPNLRVDLMINKMVENARETGIITIHNPNMHRPILGLEDLCRAVKAIIEGGNNPGIYNIASFNATISEVSRLVGEYMKKVRIIIESQKNIYNFSVNTSKFQSTYNFVFKDTVKSIVESLQKKHQTVRKTIRDY